MEKLQSITIEKNELYLRQISKKVNILTGQIDSNQFWLDVAYHLTIAVIY